jgi:hypothetical protein
MPESSVNTTRSVPRTATRALVRYWPVTRFWIRPEIAAAALGVEDGLGERGRRSDSREERGEQEEQSG